MTQTIFNDDADWEYIVPVEGEYTDKWGDTYTDIISYTIKKTNGTIMGSIPADKWNCRMSVINDVVYAINRGEDDNYYFYTLPEFRKFLSQDASAVKPVPAMVRTACGEAHDLMGRKVVDHQKGIIIKDGKKMINK